MTLSVGTIETYLPGSTEFEQTQYGDLGTDDQASLSLSDSNLWLVDSTTLNQDEIGDLSLLTLEPTGTTTTGDGYLSPMDSTTMASTTGDITVYGNDPNADSVLYSPDSVSTLSDLGSVSSLDTGLSDLTAMGTESLSNISITDLSGTEGDGGSGSGEVGGLPSTTLPGGLDGTPTLPEDIEDVPFDLHTSLGLILIGAVVVVRRRGWWRRRSIPQS